MPKQKIRKTYKKGLHYNPNAGILQGKARKARWPGSKDSVPKRRSPFMGNELTAANRREFEKKQAELYKQNYYKNTKKEEQKPEGVVDAMAKGYARYQTNKENKHFRAWKAGKSVFTYMGTTFPVLTEQFLKETRSIKEIIKENNDE